MSDRGTLSHDYLDAFATSAATSGLAERNAVGRTFGAFSVRLRMPAAIDATIATIVVLLIASPLLFTRNGFAADFTNALWLVNYQEHAIATNLHPTLFLSARQLGVFEPLFAFYGGTLFAVTGALGALLGGATILAFEAMTLAAIAAAYGGLFWLSRQLGVRSVLAHAPAIVYVTSAYYITDLYGRGDWTEFTAVSALPLVIAATLRIARGPLRFAPAACLVAATTIFSGSHNITLMLGTLLSLLALAIYWLLSGLPRQLPWRGILTATGLIALGIALNAWFLLPDVSYAHKTIIGALPSPQPEAPFFDTFSVIFDPLRMVPRESTTPALYVQAPVAAMVWGLLALPLMATCRGLRTGMITALTMLGCLLVVIMSVAAYKMLPGSLREMQFPYRLQTYVTLACAGLVLLGTLALTRRAQRTGPTPAGRLYTLGLGLVLVFGIALAAWQLWVPNTRVTQYSYKDRNKALINTVDTLPRSWYAGASFADGSIPLVATVHRIWLNAGLARNERIAGSAAFPAGAQPFATNIVGGTYLVHIGGGVHVVGRANGGGLALKRNVSGSKAVPIEVRGQLSAPVLAGRILTAATAALLLGFAALAAVRRLRRRHSPATGGSPLVS